MKSLRRIAATVLLACFAAAGVSAQTLVAEKEQKGIVYRLYDDGHAGAARLKEFKSYKDYKLEFVDELKHKGRVYRVTEIEDSAFTQCRIKRLKWPAAPLERIGVAAFADCKLLDAVSERQTISAGRICRYAFKDVYISNLSLSADVVDVDPRVFFSFYELHVDEANEHYYTLDGALVEKGTDRLLKSRSGVPQGVKIVGRYSLCECLEPDLILPSSVEVIETNALSNRPKRLETITVLTHRPPRLEHQNLPEQKYNGNVISVFVPDLARFRYERASGWGDFLVIEECDKRWAEHCDEPYFDPAEVESNTYRENRSMHYNHPYAALRMAEASRIEWAASNDFDKRQSLLEEQNKYLKRALELFEKVKNCGHDSMRCYAMGRVWQMISTPMMGGGAFEDSYRDSKLFEASFGNALAAYEQAAEAGSVAAMRELGRMWVFGWDSGGSGGDMVDDRYAPDEQRGMAYLERAAEAGDAEAAYIAAEFDSDYRRKAALLGSDDAIDELAAEYLSEGMHSEAQSMAQEMKDPERRALFEAVADATSDNVGRMRKAAEYFRSGHIRNIDFKYSRKIYAKVLQHPEATDNDRAEALYYGAELDYWIDPYTPNLKDFKLLATDPAYASSRWSGRAKAWLGAYYYDVEGNEAESRRWFDKLTADCVDLSCVRTLDAYYPASPLLKEWSAISRFENAWMASGEAEAKYYYYMSLDNSEVDEKNAIVIQFSKTDRESLVDNPDRRYIEAVLLAPFANLDISAEERTAALEQLHDRFGTPRIKVAYGRALVESGEANVRKGLQLMEEGLREATVYDDTCADLKSWRIEVAAFLAQVYGQDGESWGSDDMSVPKHTAVALDPFKAAEWRRLSNKIEWKGPSGW